MAQFVRWRRVYGAKAKYRQDVSVITLKVQKRVSVINRRVKPHCYGLPLALVALYRHPTSGDLLHGEDRFPSFRFPLASTRMGTGC